MIMIRKRKREKLIDSSVKLGVRLRRRIITELRVLFWEFRYSLGALFTVFFLGTTLVHYYHKTPHGRPGWSEAFYHTLHSIAASPTIGEFPAESKLSILFILLPVFGLLFLA